MENTWLLFGPPGSGKTSWLAGIPDKGILGQVEKAANAYGAGRVMISSFTKTAAVEIASRCPTIPAKNIGTLHAICYHALDCPELTVGNEGDFNKLHPNFSLSVSAKRGKSGVENTTADDLMNEGDAGFPGERFRSEVDILRARRIDRAKWPGYLATFDAAWTKWKHDAGYMDFTDLIEKCLLDFSSAPGDPAAIFYDEAQDASQLQAELLASWGKHTKRLILAGDDDQAIFNWAGSDAKSFLDFPCLPENRKYLRHSHRMSRAVYANSQAFVKQISRREDKVFSPRDEEGFVRVLPSKWKSPEASLPVIEEAISAGKTVMIVATCSYMLEPTKGLLKREGIPFHNPWRRRRGDWNPLASGGNDRTMPVDRLRSFIRPHLGGMWRWRDVAAWASILESKQCLIHGAKALLKENKTESREIIPSELAFILSEKLFPELCGLNFRSREQCLGAIEWWLKTMPPAEAMKLSYPRDVFARGGEDYLREDPRVIIGTGHSLKGAEADVVIIYPDISLAAWNAWNRDGVEVKDGILRLCYVMLTRAREGVYLASPLSNQSVKLLAA